jgi:hypothetical protein
MECEVFEDGVKVREERRLFSAHLELEPALTSVNVPVLEYEFSPGQQYIIIGRDILNTWSTHFDGPSLAGQIDEP